MLSAHDPARPLALLHAVMHAVPLVQSLRFIDEELSPQDLVPLMRAVLPTFLHNP